MDHQRLLKTFHLYGKTAGAFCYFTALGGERNISNCNVGWKQLEEADWLFRRLVRRFVKERDKVEIEGVSLPGMLVLHKLVRDGEQRLGDLGEELDFTSGAVTALCDKLENKGLAERKRKSNDRRAVWLDITAEGRAMLDRQRNIGASSIMTLFDDLSPEQLEQQIALSTLIFNKLEHYAEVLNRLAQDNEHEHHTEVTRSEGVQVSDVSEEVSHTGEAARPNQYLSY